ncbi:hypothetical protein EJ05DRAFT_474033 [Pseudovirgaria hyperparasitica]|uniref:Uncharacterized protein n=1 Tax=Pseudovirgaria hyperparasitica TaxID=470096 RepID=A0A6A6WE38_9PEZI|nr:uncharacterized protein EJ05DRAFT_474033 [Pseudovirgaria hyperparasitica]KAF2760126.1 hypothetical protein EJ05DRAFT_474033 [Pseudovirgaria hyperparasitica]
MQAPAQNSSAHNAPPSALKPFQISAPKKVPQASSTGPKLSFNQDPPNSMQARAQGPPISDFSSASRVAQRSIPFASGHSRNQAASFDRSSAPRHNPYVAKPVSNVFEVDGPTTSPVETKPLRVKRAAVKMAGPATPIVAATTPKTASPSGDAVSAAQTPVPRSSHPVVDSQKNLVSEQLPRDLGVQQNLASPGPVSTMPTLTTKTVDAVRKPTMTPSVNLEGSTVHVQPIGSGKSISPSKKEKETSTATPAVKQYAFGASGSIKSGMQHSRYAR